MTINRRRAIKLVGGGTILAAGTAGAFAATRTPSRALEPWNAAGRYDDPRMHALSYAILAPSPHNRQPWLADLREDGVVTIHRDRSRDLPQTDPFARQLTIGMGCFLELLAIAASRTGHEVTFELFPDGEEGAIARAVFSEGGVADPLFDQVLERRSCKEPFEDRPVPAHAIEALSRLARIETEPERVRSLRELTWAAFETEMRTPRALDESVDLMRFGKAEIEANPDGIDLGGPFLEFLMLAGQLSREAQRDPSSFGFAEGLRLYEAMLFATPAYAVIATADNGRAAQIAAGRDWLRLNLMTSELGLALHPVSQALQEFSEMRLHFERAHALLASPGETIQMLGRLGYGPVVPHAPRWPVETCILDE